jgi:hypothetical protein
LIVLLLLSSRVKNLLRICHSDIFGLTDIDEIENWERNSLEAKFAVPMVLVYRPGVDSVEEHGAKNLGFMLRRYPQGSYNPSALILKVILNFCPPETKVLCHLMVMDCWVEGNEGNA